jgi:hypothetical protein
MQHFHSTRFIMIVSVLMTTPSRHICLIARSSQCVYSMSSIPSLHPVRLLFFCFWLSFISHTLLDCLLRATLLNYLQWCVFVLSLCISDVNELRPQTCSDQDTHIVSQIRICNRHGSFTIQLVAGKEDKGFVVTHIFSLG